MRWMVTGMNGTVAPALAAALQARGDEVVPWDRSAVPTDNEGAMREFIAANEPHGLCHLAMGSPDWAATLAQLCAEQGISFLFTSSVSVFGPEQRGPLDIHVTPQATDDYGRYKQDCERAITATNPDAIIARLGWQIGQAPGSNTMTDYLSRRAAEGPVQASTVWFPSCAFLEDTAAALAALLEKGESGLFHLEGNPGLSFFEIATRLARTLGMPWEIMPDESFSMDNRMIDPRVPVQPITKRLQINE